MDELLAGAGRGAGAFAVVSGPTGHGRSTVLRRLAARAADAGAVVLTATAHRDGPPAPHATVGQLLAPLRRDDAPDDARLHTAVREAAARRTVLVTVDDLQHADEASVRDLRHLADRLAGERVALVVSWRRVPGEDEPEPLRALLYRPAARWLLLPALPPDAVVALARRHGAAAARRVAEHRALAGGSPLLATALARDAAQPGTVPGPAYARAVLTCLYRTGPVATRVARALALLDAPGAPDDPRLLGRLAGVDAGLRERALDALAEAGVLADGAFRHPAGRRAVLDGLPADEETALRRAAARLLHEEGAPAGTVAAQLLAAGPLREEWVPPLLREAARGALAGGETTGAARLLRLAVESCATDVARYTAKVELAMVRWMSDPAASVPLFLALRAPILAGKVPARHALDVALTMLWGLRFDEAVEVIEHAGLVPTDDPEEVLRARVTRLMLETMFPGVAARLGGAPALPATRGRLGSEDEALLGVLEILSAVLRQSADGHALARVEQELRGNHTGPNTLAPIGSPVLGLLCLVYSDRLTAAAEWCDRALADTGSAAFPDAAGALWRAFLDAVGAVVALRTGRPRAAVERARGALERIGARDWNSTRVLALATLAEAHTGMGELAAAAELFVDPVPDGAFEALAGPLYLHARGRHHLAEDRAHAALADFLRCGRQLTTWGVEAPGLVPWRAAAAEAWLALGEPARARVLAEEQLVVLRDEFPRTRAMALRCLAATRAPGERPAPLRAAVALLERCGARYELARVLVDLGEAHHALGDRHAAYSVRRRARRIARDCDARGLYEPAPPPAAPPTEDAADRRAPRGGDAPARLTTSERRVAALAVQGFSNREIAEHLYVTVSTVEQHLTRVYRKTGVGSRAELSAALRPHRVAAA
ncbi:helix-turn-helix transcriptional regulator [Streptomyces zhaozhouensis]|uniref:helix-turn-helix transcriptional regulator n=1 Tax=Streptomyces zhaozhouensis TaxID=1300267 RepID=UPI000BE3DDEC|nr:helix-turn-helix transcriptional regulator [Streptomyces zhaozhouensis]